MVPCKRCPSGFWHHNIGQFRLMKITLKLYAGLSQYLPENAVRNEAEIRIDPEVDLQGVLDCYGIPSEQIFLVLVNGVYIPPDDREGYMLSELDALAVCRYA